MEDTWNKEVGYNGAGEHCVIRSFMICTPHQIFLGGQIKEDMMCAACGLWGRTKHIQGLVGKPEEKREFARPRCTW